MFLSRHNLDMKCFACLWMLTAVLAASNKDILTKSSEIQSTGIQRRSPARNALRKPEGIDMSLDGMPTQMNQVYGSDLSTSQMGSDGRKSPPLPTKKPESSTFDYRDPSSLQAARSPLSGGMNSASHGPEKYGDTDSTEHRGVVKVVRRAVGVDTILPRSPLPPPGPSSSKQRERSASSGRHVDQVRTLRRVSSDSNVALRRAESMDQTKSLPHTMSASPNESPRSSRSSSRSARLPSPGPAGPRPESTSRNDVALSEIQPIPRTASQQSLPSSGRAEGRDSMRRPEMQPMHRTSSQQSPTGRAGLSAELARDQPGGLDSFRQGSALIYQRARNYPVTTGLSCVAAAGCLTIASGAAMYGAGAAALKAGAVSMIGLGAGLTGASTLGLVAVGRENPVNHPSQNVPRPPAPLSSMGRNPPSPLESVDRAAQVLDRSNSQQMQASSSRTQPEPHTPGKFAGNSKDTKLVPMGAPGPSH